MGYIEHPLIKPGTVEAREYQQHILMEAVDRNLLVVIPTGLGKTIVALLLAAYYLKNYPERKVLVMAPTRPLVLQHYRTSLDVLNYPEDRIAVITGGVSPSKREGLWKSGNLFFSTPQVVKNDVKRRVLDLKDFSLLVFDEAHRAVKEYAYTYIAREYVSRCPHPVILALTASPGGDKERIRKVCEALYIEKIVYKSELDEDVRPYVGGAELKWVKVKLPKEYAEISKILRSMLEKTISRLSEAGLLSKKRVTKGDLLQLGEELRKLAEEGEKDVYGAIIDQSAALSIYHAVELLETQGIPQLLSFLEKVWKREKKSYSKIASDPLFLRALTLARKYSNVRHPKLDALLKVLKEEEWEKCLIFTQFRDTVREIIEHLSSAGMRAERFVGQAARAGDEGMSQREQAEVLERFRSGEVRVLVATSIAEEGLDVPSVDLVVFYEPVPSEIRFIQRKGRTGRRGRGKVVILATEDTADIAYFYSSLRKVKRMKKIMRELNAELKPVRRIKPISESKPEHRPEPVPEPKPEPEVRGVEKREGILIDLLWRRDSIDVDRAWFRDVRRVQERILDMLREAAEKGEGRISVGEVLKEFEGYPVEVVALAIRNLLNAGSVYMPSRDTIAVVVPPSGTYDIVVERVYRGGATVLVNGRFRARLAAEDFPVPGLIKKNARLRVSGNLYRVNGVLHLSVWDVVY